MTIETEHDLKLALDALCAQCPIMAKIHADHGAPPLRRRAAGFAGLAEIVIFQQISIHAGRSILARTQAVLGEISPSALAGASDETLRLGGLSRPKIKTLRAIAEASLAGSLDLAGLHDADADALAAHLTAVKGIGPWTADIYALFCLGHPDIWPTGDLAVQVAVQQLLDLPTRPTAKEMQAHGERWRPYRAAAARLLWHFYGVKKNTVMEPLAD